MPAKYDSIKTFTMNKLRLLLILAALPIFARAAGVGAAVGDAARGQLVFKTCASCHQVGPYASAGYGPQLNGVIGRRAAATSDYKYSEAMRKSGIVWDERTLAAFLRAPGEVVPGTKMRFWGIKDEQQIADLLAYLRGAR